MRSFTKILLAALLLAGPAYAIAKPHYAFTKTASEIEDRHLSGFNAINVAGPFDVDIVQGAAESVKVEAPSDAMPHILTEVNNGVLKIYAKQDTWNWSHLFGFHKKIMVHVVIKDVNAISISGSGDVNFKEGVTANSLKLRISGSGDMNGKVTAKSLESSISGSGDMTVWGSANSSVVSLVGSGDFTGRSLVTASTSIRVSGSGDANINASDRIDAAVNGSGDIRYTGAAKTVNAQKSGSGDISRY
jgi:Putative auto-transporter adhesin, head GIN domain